MATRIGILGYGNLGRGIDLACAAAPDMELRSEEHTSELQSPS